MKKKIAIIAVALLVLAGVSTAVAAVGGTTFTAATKSAALKITAYSQTTGSQSFPACEWKAGEFVYCPAETSWEFTPKVNSVCQVDEYLALVGVPENGGSGLLKNVGYGIGVRVEGTLTKEFDENGITTQPTYLSAQTVERIRLIPVTAGKTYSFVPWINSHETSNGRVYWDIVYVCYGT